MFTSALAISTSAFAQDAPAPAPEPEIDATEIIVTAQRRPERLQTVPVSVTPVSGNSLRDKALSNLTQLQLAAPSLAAGGDGNFSVRGVGTLSFSQSLESSVALAVDEVNLTNAGLAVDFYDIAQVEVLNGPQGLLFGKNASAGLLNVTTNRPKIGVFGGTIEVEGDYRPTAADRSTGVITRGSLNIPLTGTSALRISGLYSDQDPIMDYQGSHAGTAQLGARRAALRGRYLWQASDKFSLNAIVDYSEDRGVGGFFDTTFRELGAGTTQTGALAGDGITAGPENIEIGGDAPYYRNVRRTGAQLKLSYVLENGLEISDIIAFKGLKRNQQLDTDYTGLNGANVNHNTTSYGQYSNELRVALPSGDRLSGQAGIYLFHSDLATDAQIAGNNYLPPFVYSGFPFCVGATAVPGAFPPTCSVSNEAFLGNDHKVDQVADALAVFGQFTYKATEKLQLIAGARFTNDKIAIDLVQNQHKYFVTLGIPYAGSQSYSVDNLSWKVGAQYNFNRQAMTYLTVGQGYKGPGFNDNAVSPTGSLVVRPEINDTVEAGVKSTWFNRKLTFNASVFSQKFSDYQVQSLDLTTSSFITQNAAVVKSQGAEVTLIGKPIEGLTLSANLSFLDAKFEDFPGAQCYPTQGCLTFNAKGLTLPGSPKFASTTEASYTFALRDGIDAFVGASLYHRDAVYYSIFQAPGTYYGAVDIVGLNAGIDTAKGWRLAIFCKNCTDVRMPVVIAVDNADAFAGVTSYTQNFGYNSFRTVGVQISRDF
ncbi:tonB dependent receptor family protein [Asticcacaulis biprosthecium C19]|uniref:TonB dependent receptor family protein n=1 Tax=Asticcacaulis biprosthecium C19 TaxID=715226 RepID=F4QTA1_9CAUL|nr:tonB dependent receptor family protein [Asticcacaulis biprosthecium C19]